MNNPPYYSEQQPQQRTESPRGAQGSYGGSQATYGGAQQAYSGYTSYEPPRDETYRSDLTVAQYDDDRSRRSSRRRKSRDSRSRDRSYYDDRRADYDDERDYERDHSSSRNRSSSRGGDKHEKVKEVGALAVGGAIGGFAAHKLGKKNGLVTTLGTLAGAWAGLELEKRHERKDSSSSKREVAMSSSGGRRSSSRPRDKEYENEYIEDRYYNDRRDDRY